MPDPHILSLSPAYRARGLLLTCLVVLMSSMVSADSISFQTGVSPTAGYAGMDDTYIDDDFPTTNYGSNAELAADGAPEVSSLMKWDLSAIPAGSTITAASLKIYITNHSSSQTYEGYEMKRNWVESQATYNVYSTGNSWGTAGAANTTSDRGTTVLITLSSTSGQQGTKVTYDFTASGVTEIQDWLDNPSTNYGIVIQDYAQDNSMRWSSSEETTSTNRPELIITYTAPAGPKRGAIMMID